MNAKRKPDETFTLLCSRLRSLFVYYLTRRKVGKDFDKLLSLMVADKLKEEMLVACLKHILAIETAGDCLDCDKLAEAADIYMHSHLASVLPRMIAGHSSGRGVSESLPETRPTFSAGQFGDAVRFGRGRSIGKTCYQCGSRDHLVTVVFTIVILVAQVLCGVVNSTIPLVHLMLVLIDVLFNLSTIQIFQQDLYCQAIA